MAGSSFCMKTVRTERLTALLRWSQKVFDGVEIWDTQGLLQCLYNDVGEHYRVLGGSKTLLFYVTNMSDINMVV